MKKQITRFSPVQTAKVLAVMYFLMGAIFALFGLVAGMIGPGVEGQHMGIGLLIAMPFIYAIMGFIFTIIGCAFYNLVAGWVGGVEFTLSDAD